MRPMRHEILEGGCTSESLQEDPPLSLLTRIDLASLAEKSVGGAWLITLGGMWKRSLEW